MKNGRILNVRLDVARSLSDRCRMILRCADGLTNKAVAPRLGVHEHTVGKWRRRFLKERIEGLSDEPRPGRPRTLTDEKVAGASGRSARRRPTRPTGRSGWPGKADCRTRRSDQPHRSETFKLSSDPHFVDKVRDIASISRRRTARWCSADEKSQIQALDRTQPVLPMLPGMPERRTHDYKRHGTAVRRPRCRTGFVIGKCYRRHFLDFLKEIDSPSRRGWTHIVMDNYATHKTAAVLAGAAVHWHVHFTPTSASWINQVERR